MKLSRQIRETMKKKLDLYSGLENWISTDKEIPLHAILEKKFLTEAAFLSFIKKRITCIKMGSNLACNSDHRNITYNYCFLWRNVGPVSWGNVRLQTPLFARNYTLTY
jgi:hypothetical protein